MDASSLFCDINMVVLELFLDSNMAATTSVVNTLYNISGYLVINLNVDTIEKNCVGLIIMAFDITYG